MIAEHIGVESELGRFHVLHLDRAGDADSRIVDQHVEPAPDLLFGIGHGLFDFIVKQDVELADADVEFLVARQLLEVFRFGARGVAHGGKDGCSQAGEMFARQLAEPGRRTGDENGLATKVGPGGRHIALRAGSRGGQRAGGGGSGKQAAAGQFGHAQSPLGSAIMRGRESRVWQGGCPRAAIV